MPDHAPPPLLLKDIRQALRDAYGDASSEATMQAIKRQRATIQRLVQQLTECQAEISMLRRLLDVELSSAGRQPRGGRLG